MNFEQLSLLDLLASVDPEPGPLVDRRRMPQGGDAGAARLLRALVKQGLDQKALRPAAALALALDHRSQAQ